MKKPNTIEDEIDRIRLKIYEETKDLTVAQRMERRKKTVEATMKKFGLKFKLAYDTDVRGHTLVSESALACN